MACRDWAAKVGGGVLGRVWALVAALALLLGLIAMAPAPAQAASFRDVPSGQWYTSWVDQASDQGLMSGFTDPATGRPTGYFGPDEPLTRAQVATVLWRMAGGPSSGHASFPDVERGSWYDAPVAWCVKAGVVTGYTSGPDRGCFRPDRPVTRQELATMVYRYAKYAGMDVADPDPSAFRSTTDWRTADSWASEALTWTAAAGVLSGVDNHDGTYSVVPFGTATRAMAAKVFVVLSGSPSAAKASYTVTFDFNGGSAVKAQTVKNGAKASKPADPTKSGYEFAGWYSDAALTKAYNFNSAVKSNFTLYAKWTTKSQAYAILYKDGLLSLQAGPDTDPSHGEVLGKWEWNGSCPWYDKRVRVKSIVVRDKIAVSHVQFLFGDLPNCKSMDLSKLDVSHVSSFFRIFSSASDFSNSPVESLNLSGWDVSGARDLSSVFFGCSSLQFLDVSGWDTSNVVRFGSIDYNGGMFSGCSSLQSLDLSGWNVSSATDFPYMFSGCSSLATLDLSGWDVSSAKYLSSMFKGCYSLQTLEVSGWDVSNATDLSGMFSGCSSLQSLDLSGWDVSNATDLSRMFSGCSSLQSLDLSGWDLSGVADLSSVFSGCSSLQSLDLSSWDVSNVLRFNSAFSDCSGLQSLDLSGWDVSSATDLRAVFSGCSSLANLDISRWDVSNATDLSSMFSGCSSLANLDISRWDVSNVTNLTYMFSGCSSLATLDISRWDVSNVWRFGYDRSSYNIRSGMFSDCSSLQSLDLSGWNVSNDSILSWMFSNCSSLRSLDLSGWDLSGAADLSGMFYGCSSLATLDISGCRVGSARRILRALTTPSTLLELDLSGIDASGEADLSLMFSGCSSLETLDLSAWDVSSATDLRYMFSDCSSLISLDLSGWDLSSATDLPCIFEDCSSLNSVTLGAGCGPLVEWLPSGPWYDADGKEYDRPPAGVAGTFTKTKTAALAVAADGVSDADALPLAQIVEGEQDGLRYVVVPEGATFEYGLEYPELAGRYVGPGVYLTGYAGESDSLVVPLEVADVPVVSANLSWNDSDRSGMTRLAFVSFERIEGKASAFVQLDVSDNLISSLDIEDLDALMRLNCEGNPIADLAALQAWATQDGHEAKLPQVQDVTPVEPDDVAAPSEPQEPASPDIPAEPANPEVSSVEPKEPSVPATPAEPEQPGNADVPGELDQSGASSDTGNLEQPEAPVDTAELGEAGQDGDASATEEQAGAVELAEPGEEPLALAA